MLPRGVWRPPCLTEDGQPFLVAIDSHHRMIHLVPLMPGEDEEVVGLTLLAILDDLDPVPAG